MKTPLWLTAYSVQTEDSRTKDVMDSVTPMRSCCDVCQKVAIEPHLRPLQRKTSVLKSATTCDAILDI